MGPRVVTSQRNAFVDHALKESGLILEVVYQVTVCEPAGTVFVNETLSTVGGKDHFPSYYGVALNEFSKAGSNS